MPNYQDGKIYKITGTNDDKKELIYIGSTTQSLSKRLAEHKRDVKRDRFVSSKIVLQCSNSQIILIELFPCISKKELIIRERYFFDLYDCVNKIRPYISNEESIQQGIDLRIKTSLINNKRASLHYLNNKDKKLEYQKQYNILNSDRIKEYQKQYKILKKNNTNI